MSHKSLNLQQWLSTAWDFCTPRPMGHLAMSRNAFCWGGVLLRNLIGRGQGAANHHAPHRPHKKKSCLVLNGSSAADGKPWSVGYLMSPFFCCHLFVAEIGGLSCKVFHFLDFACYIRATSFHMFCSFLWIGSWIQRSLIRFRSSPVPPRIFYKWEV